MMNGVLLTLVFAVFLPSGDLCIESWHRGFAKIPETETTVVVSCSKESLGARYRLQTAGRGSWFELTIEPAEAKMGTCDGSGTLGWSVTMRKVVGGVLSDDVLRPTNDPSQDYFTAVDVPGMFLVGTEGGATEGAAGLCQERVIKVEGFYVSLRASHPGYTESGMMKSLRLVLRITHSKPDCEK